MFVEELLGKANKSNLAWQSDVILDRYESHGNGALLLLMPGMTDSPVFVTVQFASRVKVPKEYLYSSRICGNLKKRVNLFRLFDFRDSSFNRL